MRLILINNTTGEATFCKDMIELSEFILSSPKDESYSIGFAKVKCDFTKESKTVKTTKL